MTSDLKIYRFGEFTTGSPNLAPQYTNMAIQGRVVKVFLDLAGGTTNGSIFLACSGTDELLWLGKNVTADTTVYPAVVPVDNQNVNIGSQAVALGGNTFAVPRVVTEPLYLMASGVALANTGSGITDVFVYYE